MAVRSSQKVVIRAIGSWISVRGGEPLMGRSVVSAQEGLVATLFAGERVLVREDGTEAPRPLVGVDRNCGFEGKGCGGEFVVAKGGAAGLYLP